MLHGNHSHLAYVLTLPKEPGGIQEAFNITKSGSYIISVKALASLHYAPGLYCLQEPPRRVVDYFFVLIRRTPRPRTLLKPG